MPSMIAYREKDGATFVAGSTKDDGQIVASPSAVVFSDPTKFCVENIGDRPLGGTPFVGLLLKRVQVGSNDGIAYIRTADDPNGTISKPWGIATDPVTGVLTGSPTATRSAGGGSGWALAPYGVVVTANLAGGETIASVEITFTPLAADDTWVIEWVGPVGAGITFKVYLTTTPGTYGATTLVSGAVSSPTVTKSLTAPTVGAGTPAVVNTTGGAGPDYGTPPVDAAFGTADLTIASAPAGLMVGQQWFCYYIERLPAAATSLGNKRQGKLFPTEV